MEVSSIYLQLYRNTCRTKRRARVKNVNLRPVPPSPPGSIAPLSRFVLPPGVRVSLPRFARGSTQIERSRGACPILREIISGRALRRVDNDETTRGLIKGHSLSCRSTGSSGGGAERDGQTRTSLGHFFRIFEGDGEQGGPRARLPTFIKNSRRVPRQEAPY